MMTDGAGELPRSALPTTLAGFRGRHAGEAIVVCGCGESLPTLASPERFVTIGVNDVGRLFQPDYLLVANRPGEFVPDRFRYVAESRARALFTPYDLGVDHPHVVRFTLGIHGGTDFGEPEILHYTQNSPYIAVCLAMHLGAAQIGLIGVDFTDHHFFRKTGRHRLTSTLERIDSEYRRLRDACARSGVEVFNLSATSRLTSLPRKTVERFREPRDGSGQLKIVSYATTPVAGVPVIPAPSHAIMERSPAPPPPSPPRLPPSMPSAGNPESRGEDAGALTVVIPLPSGGEGEGRSLGAVLERLAGCGAAAVVVESGSEPRSKALVERFGFRHVLVPRGGMFHGARAVRAGIAEVRTELLMWCDADVLVSSSFLCTAVEELRGRGLDCLRPWSSVRHLSEGDSAAVAEGTRPESDCQPVSTRLTGRPGPEAVVLVRTAFLQRMGGVSTDPLGREGPAFFRRASAIGRAASTRRTDQHIYRLCLPSSQEIGREVTHSADPNRVAQGIRPPETHASEVSRTPVPSASQSGPPAPHWASAWRTRSGADSAVLGRAVRARFGGAPEPRVAEPVPGEVEATTILVKIPTRARPARILQVVRALQETADDLQGIGFLISCDSDDETMKGRPAEELLALGCDVRWGSGSGKVDAVNRDVDGQSFDILILAADDMFPRARGWDTLVRATMRAHFPNLDGALHFDDGHTQARLNTLPILGYNLFRKMLHEGKPYIYHPAYLSLWCDNEMTDVLRAHGRLPYIPHCIIEHRHPTFVRGMRADQLLQHNQSFHDRDRATYEARRAAVRAGARCGFDSPPVVLSILIPSLRHRSDRLRQLLAAINDQINALPCPWSVELWVDVDDGRALVGTKRNRLLDRANGAFVVFVDDDDLVAPDYVARILGAIDGTPHCDCVSLRGVITTNGQNPRDFHHSIGYSAWGEVDGRYVRTPNHLNAIRAAHARAARFPDAQCGEDSEFSNRLRALGLLKVEADSGPEPLYFYRFDYYHSATQALGSRSGSRRRIGSPRS
jgi:hypothetical protein